MDGTLTASIWTQLFLGEKFNIFSFVFFYLMFAIVFLVAWLGLGTNMFTFISPSQDYTLKSHVC